MTKYEALVRIAVTQRQDVSDSPTDYLTRYCADPEIGVLVLDIKVLNDRRPAPGVYAALVHVRVRQPPEFTKILPKDYLRINLTDEDFGMLVEEVNIIPPEPN